jgi:hypothetical protein
VETCAVERRKVFEYIGLFLFLAFVYAVALSRYLNFVSADGAVGGPVYKYTSRPHAANCQVLHFRGVAIRCFGLLREELAFQ